MRVAGVAKGAAVAMEGALVAEAAADGRARVGQAAAEAVEAAVGRVAAVASVASAA